MEWILQNKEWLFSGIGISAFMFLAWLGKKFVQRSSSRRITQAAGAGCGLIAIGFAYWGIWSGYLTTHRQFSWLQLSLPALVGVGVSGWVAYAVAKQRVGSLTSELSAVKMHDTFRDHVTLALNTNAVAHTFIECSAIARTRGGQFSALLLDLDGFKRINELHDIKGGDRCLREVAVLLTKTLRGESDKLVRFRHGDEFLILLPETGVDNAEFVAKRVVQLIEKSDLPVSDRSFERLTASVGYTHVDASLDNIEQTTDRLDRALKKAKKIKNTYARC